MVYAQFFGDSTGWNGKDFAGPVKVVPMCGSDAVCHLDGRMSLANLKVAAQNKAASINDALKKGIRGFQLMRGERYTTAKPISDTCLLRV